MTIDITTVAEGITLIRMDRERVLNAMNEAMVEEIEAAFHTIERDNNVRAYILTGTGRGFCVGTDLKEASGVSASHRVKRMHALILRMVRFPKIGVAAINGLALGGGLEIAMACTFRVAASTARMGLPEVTHSLMPAYGGTQLLPRLVGRTRGLEMALSGEMIGADRAEAIGLVNAVADDPVAAAIALAQRCTQGSALARREILHAAVDGIELPLEQGLALEYRGAMAVADSAEAQAGVDHFRNGG
jgi:enoyl-CoA hydratase/carnithine racemase